MSRIEPSCRQRPPIRLVWLVAAVVAGLGGCRGNQARRMYEEHMAAEIRILEDQLYQADNEIRILRQELDQQAPSRLEPQADTPRNSPTPAPAPKSPSKTTPKSTTPPRIPLVPQDDPAPPRSSNPRLPNNSSNAEPPNIDVSPGSPAPSILPPAPRSNGNTPPSMDIPPEVPPTKLGNPQDIQPPPVRNDDIVDPNQTPPNIDVGSAVLPPPKTIAPPDAKEKVKLPTNVQRMLDEPAGPPEEIRLDPAETKPFSQNDRGGLDVVLLAFDGDGRPTKINNAIEIAVIDPAIEGPEGRLGRWFVQPDQVRQATGTDQVVRLHLFWEDGVPANRTAKVFVRMRDQENKLIHTHQLVALTAIQPAIGCPERPRGRCQPSGSPQRRRIERFVRFLTARQG